MDGSASRVSAGLLLVTAAVLVVACGSEEVDVLARSELGVVTRSDLDRHILQLAEPERRPKDDQDPTEWRLGLLRDMMVIQGLEREADELELLEDPAVRAEVDIAREQVILAAALQEYVAPRTTVSDDELRRYYDEHPEEFGHPEQIRLRHIFRRVAVDASDDERAELRAEMETMLEKLRQGAHFGDLARQHSDSETAQIQGLIGRLSRGQMDADIENIVWGLDKGEISEVVATPVGFHIFKLEDHVAPFKMDFEEARGRLHQRLSRLAREEAMNALEKELLAESGAEYRPELLQAGRPDAEQVLFALGEREVTGADLETYRTGNNLVQVRKLPPSQWLVQTCRNRLLIWKAEEDGIDQRPEVIRQIEQAENNVKISKAFNRRLEEQVAMLEESGVFEEYFEQNILRFKTPRLHRLRLTTLDFDRFEPPYDAFQLLDTIARECRAGTRDFAEAARELSDDLSAEDAGDLGWVSMARFVEWAGPRAQKQAAHLEAGEISEPFITEKYVERQLKYERTGFAVVKVEGIREPEMRPFAEVRDRVVRRYLSRYRAELEEKIADEVLSDIGAEIYEDRL